MTNTYQQILNLLRKRFQRFGEQVVPGLQLAIGLRQPKNCPCKSSQDPAPATEKVCCCCQQKKTKFENNCHFQRGHCAFSLLCTTTQSLLSRISKSLLSRISKMGVHHLFIILGLFVKSHYPGAFCQSGMKNITDHRKLKLMLLP